MHAHTQACTYTHNHAHTQACTYTHKRAHTHTSMHIHTPACTYSHKHAHTHTDETLSLTHKPTKSTRLQELTIDSANTRKHALTHTLSHGTIMYSTVHT